MDDQETDHVAQRKTTRITHKELMATVCVAKDVVTPKRHEDSQRTDGQQGVHILHADKEDHAQDRQGDTAQTGGQAIDTVYQVNGVRDMYFWDMGSSSLSFNMLYEYLFLFVGMTLLYLVGVCDDLVGVGYRYKFAVQIVSALLLVLSGNWFGSLGGLFGVYSVPAWVGIPVTVFIVVQAEAYHKEHGHQDHRKKRQAAQTGDRRRMYLTGIRDII